MNNIKANNLSKELDKFYRQKHDRNRRGRKFILSFLEMAEQDGVPIKDLRKYYYTHEADIGNQYSPRTKESYKNVLLNFVMSLNEQERRKNLYPSEKSGIVSQPFQIVKVDKSKMCFKNSSENSISSGTIRIYDTFQEFKENSSGGFSEY